MENDLLQIMRIADGLVTYCYRAGARTITARYELRSGEIFLQLSAPDLVLSAEEQRRVRELIGKPWHEEIGEYYGPLAGSSIDGPEFTLFSMMADRLELRVDPEEGTLFTLYRPIG